MILTIPAARRNVLPVMKKLIERGGGQVGKVGGVPLLLLLAAILAAGIVVALTRIGPPGATTAKRYLIEPAGVVDGPVTRFSWHRPADTVRYFLEVRAQDGTLLWSQSTADTTLAAPRSLAFDSNRVYRWKMTYTFADGVSLSTDEEEFQVLPPPGGAP